MKNTAETLVTVGGKRPKKRLTAEQRRKRRKIQKTVVGAILLLVLIFVWFGMQPLRGNMDYGLCRTFAELRVKNPETIKIISYENFGGAWKVFYSYIGEYGEQRSNFIDCSFGNDPARGHRILKEVKINRQPVDQSQLDLFNLTVPSVIAGQPDLSVPIPLEETDLKGLHH